MSGSGGSGNGGELGGSEDGLDFLFGNDGPFGLPATSEEFFDTGPSSGRAEVGLWSFWGGPVGPQSSILRLALVQLT